LAETTTTVLSPVTTLPETTTTTVESQSAKGITFFGIPESIDPKTVDRANHDVFKNRIGLGSDMIFGEPGALLVGPDFDSKSNPYGDNPGGWQTMYESEGSIRPFSPVSQEVMHQEGPFYQNLPEGGFILASAAQMTIEIGDAKIVLPYMENNNYFFAARGMYGDNQQDTDRNGTAIFTEYKPGHALVNMFEPRDETNSAFISEGQFLQMAETSHSHGTNGGDGGNSILTVVMYDANTQAVNVIEQTLGRNQDASQGWKNIFSNWFNN